MQYLALFAKYNTFIMYHVTTYMSIIINIYFRGIDTLINKTDNIKVALCGLGN